MSVIPSLDSFLASKPLYYKEIDHERVHIAYGILKPHIKRPVTVHVVGTNGKGSTGRMIAHLAYAYRAERSALSVEKTSPSHQPPATSHQPPAIDHPPSTIHHRPSTINHQPSTIHHRPSTINHRPLSVGHYTSPHILRFNERIWLDGADVSDEVLEAAHRRLYGILGQEVSEGLSYFEYTTLLAFVVFENCDLMVLEAGLGGEYDATNVCDKELSVITPIGLDHQAFLGETIEEIAATKLRSIQTQALLAPQPYPEVVEVAKKIAEDVGAELWSVERLALSVEDKKPAFSFHSINELSTQHSTLNTPNGWPDFLIQNARVAMAALDILGIPYDVNDLRSLELFGRFYPLTEHIRIDVGHNPLAARAIVGAMEPGTVLIYNSLDDKDYDEVLRILAPRLKRVEIIPIDSQRATTAEAIEAAVKRTGLPYRVFDGTLEEDERYLVFGSFYVVEAFLRNAVSSG